MHDLKDITLETPDGTTIEGCTIPGNVIIKDLIKDIADQLGYTELELYSLRLKGSVTSLDNDKTLEECGVKDSDVIGLVGKDSSSNDDPRLSTVEERFETARLLQVFLCHAHQDKISVRNL